MKKILFVAIILIAAVIASVFFLLSGQKIKRQIPYVAVVNNQGIAGETYEARKKQLDYFTKWLSDHQTTSSAVPGDLMDALIEETLTLQFAREHQLLPTTREVEEKYQKAVASVGTEKEYLEKIKKIQGASKEDVILRITLEIAKERIEQFTRLPFNAWLARQKEIVKIEKFAAE